LGNRQPAASWLDDQDQEVAVRARGNGTHVGDLAKRVAHRREELGLTLDEVARRAGMDGGFLDYLEHSSAPSLTIEALTRLAFALETTVTDLAGGNVYRPPGTGRAGPHPSLEVLSREQCEAHLAAGGVGRIVFLAERGPVAQPVNFRFVDGDIVFRTNPTGPLASAIGATVGFEADHIDEAMSEGWSVVVTGRARRVDDPSELEQLGQLGIEPWAGGSREAIIRVKTAEISGRNIRQES
jgi:transcriptional regulator with XRE-family HTH domain